MEHPLPTLIINNRQNSLTTKTSVKMRLSDYVHQVFGGFYED